MTTSLIRQLREYGYSVRVALEAPGGRVRAQPGVLVLNERYRLEGGPNHWALSLNERTFVDTVGDQVALGELAEVLGRLEQLLKK